MRNSYKGIKINTAKNTHEKVFSLIDAKPESTIIDIPSGNGAFIQRLLDHNYTNVKAVDIVNILQIEHEDFVVGDMTKEFPFEDNSIDTFICIDGIEHIREQGHFISEANRVLKTNGEIIISTPNISSLKSRWKWLITGHHHKCDSPLDENNPNPLHHIAMISYPELRYLLHTNNLIVETVTCNRIKPANYLFALLIPLIYMVTFLRYSKKGKKEGTQKINKEIMKTMFKLDVLLGETLIVKGRKK